MVTQCSVGTITISTNQTDYFDKLEKDLGIKLSTGQRKWYCHQQSVLGDKIKQEFPSTVSEAFISSSDAYYYQQAIEAAYQSSRCLSISPYDPLASVYVAMDIGVNDLTVMAFFQLVHGEIRIIDYYEDKNKGVDFYARYLQQDKKYVYHTIFLPHDAAHRDGIIVENTYERDFRRLFSASNTRFIVLKRTDKNINISNSKLKFDRCVFNLAKVKPFLDKLSKYRKKWSEQFGKYLDEPLHDLSCFVSGTCVKTSQGEVVIENIKVGDMITTPSGFRKVINTFKYSTKNLVKITTSTSEIICTGHHKIFSKKGLVNADSLSYNDYLITSEDRQICNKISSIGARRNIGFRDCFSLMSRERLSDLMEENTQLIKGDISEQAANPCRGKFGFITMGQFRMDLKSIILMKTKKITTFLTSLLFREASIKECTCVGPSEKSCLEKLWINIEKRQKHGILPQTELLGTRSTEKNLWGKCPFLTKLVQFALGHIKQFIHGLFCVRQIAEQNTEELREKTTSKESVSSVRAHMNVANFPNKNRVLQNVPIVTDGSQDVYDLEVEDDHCYFANGILVSNSNYADCFQYCCQAVSHLEAVGDTKGALEKHRAAVDARRGKI